MHRHRHRHRHTHRDTVYTCTHTHKHSCTHTHSHTCTHTHTHTRTRAHTYALPVPCVEVIREILPSYIHSTCSLRLASFSFSCNPSSLLNPKPFSSFPFQEHRPFQFIPCHFWSCFQGWGGEEDLFVSDPGGSMMLNEGFNFCKCQYI
jgi:hypothetical protein